MKKTLSLLMCMLCFTMANAQIAAKYGKGAVPVVNGRVLFQDTITCAKNAAETYQIVNDWANARFAKPNVILSKMVTNDAVNGQVSLAAEEWMVFKDKFFVLDRTRINYWMDFQCTDGQCIVKMGRISYWYEEEREDGLKFKAEEMITDDYALNEKGTKMWKQPGKFRKKTIDFFENIVNTLNQKLQ